MINPAELRKLTLEAIEVAEQERKQKESQRETELKVKQLAEQEKAFFIIKTIPELAKKAALKGLGFAAVMKVPHDELVRENFHNIERVGQVLTGVSKVVYDYCEEAGLKPRLTNWWDYMGNGGFQIEIHWL